MIARIGASATLAAVGLALGACQPANAQLPPPKLVMTCHPMYKGNDLGPQVYRLEGVELVKTDPVRAEPIVLSSSVRRQPLDRVVSNGRPVFTTASHRINGQVLTRSVFWLDAAGKVTRRMTEVYDFNAKTIRGLTGDIQRCR